MQSNSRSLLLCMIFILNYLQSNSQIYYQNLYDINGKNNLFNNGFCIIGNFMFINGGQIKSSINKPFTFSKIDLNTQDTLFNKVIEKDSLNFLSGFGSSIEKIQAYHYNIGTIYTSNNKYIPFMIKINDFGDTIFFKKYYTSDTLYKRFDCIKASSDDKITILGTKLIAPNNYDFWLLKLDTLGNILWEQTYGGSQWEYGYNLDTTKNGELVLAGFTESFGAGSYDGWIVKTDSMGNQQWALPYGTQYSDAAYIKSLRNGDFLIYSGRQTDVGNGRAAVLYRIDSVGNILWQKDYFPVNTSIGSAFVSAIELPDGSIVAAGSGADATLPGNRPSGQVIKINANGDSLWSQRYTVRTNDHYINTVSALPNGDLLMSGYVFPDDTSNTEDGWLIRTDSMGCLIPNCFTEVEELLNIDVGLLIYPNPNDGKFVVEIENIEAAVVGGRRQEEMRVLILDIFGRVVYEKIVNSNSQKFEIDISENASGIYFVNICSNAYSKTIKLVKE